MSGPGALELVATVGPASEARVAELTAAGATSLRVNASHLVPGALAPLLTRIRAQAPRAPVVVDLQGAKMRLGRFAERPVRPGEVLAFAVHPSGPGEVPLEHPELYRGVGPGDTLTCDDGRLQLRIEEVGPQRLRATVLKGEHLRPRKGVNVLEHPVDLAALTARDAAFLDEAEGVEGLAWAFSFMRDGSEAAWVRERSPGRAVIGKIERAEATDAIGTVATRVDSLWICRGDLGEQLGLPGLARFVGAFDPGSVQVPVLMAGQVLEHLTAHPEPTRSEVCHLGDLIVRGYRGLVLSDETAIGVDPVHATRVAAGLLRSLTRG